MAGLIATTASTVGKRDSTVGYGMPEKDQAIRKHTLVMANGQPVTSNSIQSHHDSPLSAQNISLTVRPQSLPGAKSTPAWPVSGQAHRGDIHTQMPEWIHSHCSSRCDTQVGIVDHFWKQKFLAERQVGDKEINLTAANGERILYDRWVELTVRST